MYERVRHIDIARGISIFLVALFHSKLRLYYPETIDSMSLFRMPLFFLLAGIFFSWKLEPRAFLINKSEALLKPYFSVLLILLFISALSGGDHLLQRLWGIFYGNGDTIVWIPLWFLTHLFAVYLFVYALYRFLGFDTLPLWLKMGVLTSFMLLGTVNIGHFWYTELMVSGHTVRLPGLPFSIDIVLVTSTFFVLGNLLREQLMRFRPDTLLMLSALAALALIYAFTDAHINFNKRVYESPMYATLGAVSGIYLVLSVSWYLSKVQWPARLFSRLGEASLYILIFHSYIQSRVFLYLSNGVAEQSILTGIAVVSLLVSVCLPLVIRWFVLRNDIISLLFLPFATNRLLRRKVRSEAVG